MTDMNFAEFLDLGAIVQKFQLSNGKNIVLGFPNSDLYKKYPDPYFGQTIGRVANRIENACIEDLNGQSYQLFANNGPNTLHGGKIGWGLKSWKKSEDGLTFNLISDDGDEGFPGQLEVKVQYQLSQEDGAKKEKVNVLKIEYEARLIGDTIDETVIGMTNHSYFNLSNGPNIEGTQVTLSTNQHLPVNENLIPTGQVKPYTGIHSLTPFILGDTEPDIDHCFIMDPFTEEPNSIPIDTRHRPTRLLASFTHPDTKIHLEVFSTEPAFQFYTGKYIDVPEIRASDGSLLVPKREARSGFCVEPSRYINAVNVPEWKNMVVLRKGQTYGTKIIYRAWIDNEIM